MGLSCDACDWRSLIRVDEATLRWDLVLAVGVAAAFALRCLLLIDATGLWSDELYSVGKSFQASPVALIGMLREDTHPPAYYALLWIWGQIVGQSPITLRLLSWLAYLAGGLVMVAQSKALGGARALPLALLLAFCSPFPVRFAIEGKSYALLVLLVALAWWWRRAERPVLYGCAVAFASLTHFYGLFLFLAASFWDGWQRRWALAWAAGLALLPSLGWIGYASSYLFSSRSGSWIGRRFRPTGRHLGAGHRCLAASQVAADRPALNAALARCEQCKTLTWNDAGLFDRTGLILRCDDVGCGGCLVRQTTGLQPLFRGAVAGWYRLVVQAADLQLDRRGRWLVRMVLVVMLMSWWGPGFAQLDPAVSGVREADHFRAISQRAAGVDDRYSPRARLLNLSDRMEAAMGRLESPMSPWQGSRALRAR